MLLRLVSHVITHLLPLRERDGGGGDRVHMGKDDGGGGDGAVVQTVTGVSITTRANLDSTKMFSNI